jgi:hypothetical protein
VSVDYPYNSTPAGLALALSKTPDGWTRIIDGIRGRPLHEDSSRRRAMLQHLKSIEGLIVGDRRAGANPRMRVLVLRARCVEHEDCRESLEMAEACAEDAHRRRAASAA